MAKAKKTKKSSKPSLAERMAKKKEDLAKRASGSGNKFIFLKEGTLRVRLLPVGEDNDFIYDVAYPYLGNDIGGFISPSTFNEPCAVAEAYDHLKSSSDPEDKDLAKKITPKKKGVILVVPFKDNKGKEVDHDNAEKLVLLANSLQQEVIDLYLDDDWGDMTDPNEGYDIKLTRTGKGQFDTEYSCKPAKNSKTPKKYAKGIYDLEEIVRGEVPTYEETVEKLEKFFGMTQEEIMGETKKKKTSKKKKSSDKKKKKKKSDLD